MVDCKNNLINMECTCNCHGDMPQQSFAIRFLSNLGPFNPFPASHDLLSSALLSFYILMYLTYTANNMDLDQTAPFGSGFILFASMI